MITKQILPDPWYITGVVNISGCFSLNLRIENSRIPGRIRLYKNWHTSFSVLLMPEDSVILELLKSYFGCGKIYRLRSGFVTYCVSNRKDQIEKIIPHFANYPLCGKKSDDFQLWEETVKTLSQAAKRRRTPFEGDSLRSEETERITEISHILKQKKRPYTGSLDRINTKLATSPYFITGVINATGGFSIRMSSHSGKTMLQITTMLNNKELIEKIRLYFRCGRVYRTGIGDLTYLVRNHNNDLTKYVIPHFDIYPMLGQKQLDFSLWREATKILSYLSTGVARDPKELEPVELHRARLHEISEILGLRRQKRSIL